MSQQPVLPLSVKSSTSTTALVCCLSLSGPVHADEAPAWTLLDSASLFSEASALSAAQKSDLASLPLIKPMGCNSVIGVEAESKFKTQILSKKKSKTNKTLLGIYLGLIVRLLDYLLTNFFFFNLLLIRSLCFGSKVKFKYFTEL